MYAGADGNAPSCRQTLGARHAAAQARPRGLNRAVGPAGRLRCDARAGVAPPNSCRNAGPPQVSAFPLGGRPRAARPRGLDLRSPSVRCARTTAASQFAMRADARRPRRCASRRPQRPRGRGGVAALGSGGRGGCKRTARAFKKARLLPANPLVPASPRCQCHVPHERASSPPPPALMASARARLRRKVTRLM